MKNRLIVLPLLLFIARSQQFLDLDRIALNLGLGADKLYTLALDAQAGRFDLIDTLRDDFAMQARILGEKLGLLLPGTEFEVVPVQGEFNIDVQEQATEEFTAWAKAELARKMGIQLLNDGLISFEVIPWQQVKQRNQWDRCWQLKGKLQALKEK